MACMQTSEVILEGMRAAKAKGAIISFDLNYRAKLWAIHGGLEKAQEVACPPAAPSALLSRL